jgi:hypothetical protein
LVPLGYRPVRTRPTHEAEGAFQIEEHSKKPAGDGVSAGFLGPWIIGGERSTRSA